MELRTAFECKKSLKIPKG